MVKKSDLWISLIILLYLVVLIRNSWASDDAFITLRVINNILHGYGPNWNVIERVQVYTHPLWLIALIPFYVATRNPFATLFIACIVFSTLTLLILLKKISGVSWMMLIVTALLLTSKSFMDYSSSGLENPFSHLLVTIFVWQVLRQDLSISARVLTITLIVSLAMLNRLDTALIYLPTIILVMRQSLGEIRKIWKRLAAGFLPIIAWEFFSAIYYGFPFPNTYYAKLSTGILQSDLYKQGWLYYQNALQWDHITIPFIAIVLVLTLIWGKATRRSLAIGIVLYLLYILYIGGDFMSGRFFSTPFIAAIALFLSIPIKVNEKIGTAISVVLASLVVFAGMTSVRPPLLIEPTTPKANVISETGIADEKFVYFSCCSLLDQYLFGNAPTKVVETALQARKDRVPFVLRESIGIFGFYAGPNVYVMDTVCLSDPLRARLPVEGEWRIGHFPRPYPDGYIESIVAGDSSQIQDPGLRKYNERLQLITRGDLFSLDRLRTIIEFNLGFYDPLLENYVARYRNEK